MEVCKLTAHIQFSAPGPSPPPALSRLSQTHTSPSINRDYPPELQPLLPRPPLHPLSRFLLRDLPPDPPPPLLLGEVLDLDLPLHPHAQNLRIDGVAVRHRVVGPHRLGDVALDALLHPVGPAAHGGRHPPVDAGQDDEARIAREDLVEHGLGHGAGVQRGRDEAAVVDKALGHPGGGEVGRDKDGADRGRFVAVLELGRQALVESDRARFRAAVVRHPRGRHEARQRGHRHDAPVVPRGHGGKELARHAEQCELVHGHDTLEAGVLEVDDGVVVCCPRVVEEDSGVAVLGLGLVAGGGDGRGGSQVTFDVVYIRG